MSKMNRFGKCLIGMILVAWLALGGLYGCATSSESSAPPPSAAPPSASTEPPSAGPEAPAAVSEGRFTNPEEDASKK